MLNVCARGKSVAEAQQRAYAAVDKIKWPDGFCRRDIGWRAIAREKNKLDITKSFESRDRVWREASIIRIALDKLLIQRSE